MSVPIPHESIYRLLYVCQFWFTCCKYILKYASLDICGDHFKIKMAARYHVDSDGSRLHINLYIKNYKCADFGAFITKCTIRRKNDP